jgi:hypothetical protein
MSFGLLQHFAACPVRCQLITLLYRGARLVYHSIVYSISFACCVLTEAHRLFAKQLPPKKQLYALLDAYFNNIHPIQVFAFEHKPLFI